jgi:excisionase family DNA binding protein
MTSAADEIFYTPDEWESLTKIPKSWLYGRIHEKNLPFPYTKIGRYVRIPKSGLEQFLAQQTRGEK